MLFFFLSFAGKRSFHLIAIMGKANTTIIVAVHFDGPSLFGVPMASIRLRDAQSHIQTKWRLSVFVCLYLCALFHHALITHWYTFHCNLLFYAMHSNTLLDKTTFSQISFLFLFILFQQTIAKIEAKQKLNCWLKPFTHDDGLSALDINKALVRSFARVRARIWLMTLPWFVSVNFKWHAYFHINE